MSARGRRGGGRGALIGKKRRTPAELAAARAKKLAQRDLLPAPASKAGSRAILRVKLPSTPEVEFIRRAALSEALAGTSGPYTAELAQLRRRTYNAARGKQRPRKPKAKPGRIRVRMHWRGRPKR